MTERMTVLCRHMMLHLVEGIRENGPCWTWSMFGFERLWGRLTRWMHNRTHPGPCMMSSFKAHTVATTAHPNVLEDIMADTVSAGLSPLRSLWLGHKCQSSSIA